MIGTFLWLLRHGARNRLRRQLRRLRDPRYSVAVGAGLAYFWLIFLRPGRPAAPFADATTGDTAPLVYALGFAVVVASFWFLGSDRAALTFTPAEVQLLFPAPVRRRQLVELKLLQAQFRILVSTVIWVFLLGATAGSFLLRGIALWVIFTTLSLHRVGASLVRASAAAHGVASARRHAGALIVFGAAAAAVAWSVAEALPALRVAAAAGDLGTALTTLLHQPAMRAVLTPFRLVLAPLFASTAGEWLRAIGPALLIVVAHVPWVLRTDAAFEEAAAEAAARRAAQLGAARSRAVRVRAPRRQGAGTSGWLPLRPAGPPAVAIAWKNALALVRLVSPAMIVGALLSAGAILAMVLAIAPGPRSATNVVGLGLLGFAALLVLMGPRWIRNDLRLDMLRLEVLRSYPLSGAAIVRAEIAASVLALTAIQIALLIPAAVLIPRRPEGWYALPDRTALLIAIILTLPALNAAGLLIQNAAALLFPGWMRLGLVRTGGVEAVGQSLVTTIGGVVTLVVVLAVPGLAGIALAVFGVAKVGLWGLVPAAAAGSALVLAELWMITAWLGRVFDRTEPLELEPAV